MSSQQKAQAANSKLQPSAASFKSRNRSISKVPWVETGLSCLRAIVSALTVSWPDKLLICRLLGNMHYSCSRKACRETVLSGTDHINTPWWCALAKTGSPSYLELLRAAQTDSREDVYATLECKKSYEHSHHAMVYRELSTCQALSVASPPDELGL